MIDSQIEKILNEYHGVLTPLLDRSPALTLDGSWVSLGVTELLLFPFRGLDQLPPSGLFLLKGSAAYLARIAYECWMAFGAEVVIREGSTGVEIIATAGPGLAPGDKVEIFVERDLVGIAREIPKPFPVIGEFTRNVGVEDPFLMSYALGVVTGLSPFGNGVWKEKRGEEAAQHVDAAVKVLASGIARHYGARFSHEQLGQVPELYLNSLIYPPEFMESDVTSERAVSGLFEFCQTYEVGEIAAGTLASNLALLGDAQIADAGIAYRSAIIDTLPSKQFVSACKSRGPKMGLIRNAMCLVRQNYNLPMDWLFSDFGVSYDASRVDLELVLGFYPWIKIAPEVLKDPKRRANGKFKGALVAIASFDMEHAIEMLDKYLEENPGDVPVQVQRLYLDFLQGDSKKVLGAAKGLLSEPGADREALLFDVLGMCAFAEQNVEDSLKYYQRAYQSKRSSSVFHYDITNNFGWVLSIAERYEEALDIFDEALRGNPSPLPVLLNKSFVLFETGMSAELEATEEELITLAPFDPQVFGNIIYRQIGL